MDVIELQFCIKRQICNISRFDYSTNSTNVSKVSKKYLSSPWWKLLANEKGIPLIYALLLCMNSITKEFRLMQKLVKGKDIVSRLMSLEVFNSFYF